MKTKARWRQRPALGSDHPCRAESHACLKGRPGEQATMFLLDPSGNALEFKAFADRSWLFAK